MFAGWGSWVARFRWPVLTVALVAVIGMGAWGLGVFGQLTEGGYNDPNSESTRASQTVEDAFGARGGDLVVIYTPDNGKIDDAALGKRIRERLAALPTSAVAKSTSYWNQKSAQYVAKDKSSAIAVITLAGGDDDAKLDSYREIDDKFAVSGASAQLSGGVALADASSTRSTSDLGTAELISLPITLILLLFLFGSLVAASLPVLVGGAAVLGSLGVLHLIASFHEVNSFAVNVASLLGLGMAIDYGLFMVGRFREEQAEGRTPAEAVSRTVGTAGRTVVFSATLLMIALAGLLLFPQGYLNSLAYGGLAAVFFAAVLSLTLLPAMLAALGKRVDKLPVHLPRRAKSTPGSGWTRLAGFVLRRPLVVAIPILAALLLLASPVASVKFGDSDERTLPAGDPARQAIETLKADYPQFSGNGVQIVLSGGKDTAAFAVAARHVPGIAQLSTAERANGVTLFSATLKNSDPYSNEARDVVSALRALPVPAGTDLLVGGTTARNVDSLEATASRLPLMIGLLVGATLLLMFLAFGSVLLPIKAVLMSALSLSATFGVLVWIFQQGHGSDLLNVTPAPLEVGIVVLMAAVVFGLSTDYEVFLLSRMVEARARGASSREAVTTGLTRTGRVISAAAALLIVVTGAFGLSSVTTMRFVGVGMIVALVLDATIVRMLLVPAVLSLLGDAAWWAPGPLRRLQQRAGLSEYAAEQSPPLPGRHAAPDDTAVLTGVVGYGRPARAMALPAFTSPGSAGFALPATTSPGSAAIALPATTSPGSAAAALPAAPAPEPAAGMPALPGAAVPLALPAGTSDVTAVIPRIRDEDPAPRTADDDTDLPAFGRAVQDRPGFHVGDSPTPVNPAGWSAPDEFFFAPSTAEAPAIAPAKSWERPALPAGRDISDFESTRDLSAAVAGSTDPRTSRMVAADLDVTGRMEAPDVEATGVIPAPEALPASATGFVPETPAPVRTTAARPYERAFEAPTAEPDMADLEARLDRIFDRPAPEPIVSRPRIPAVPAVPAQAAPAQAAPAQAIPAQAIPAQAIPAQAIPAQAAPAQAIPTQAAPAQAILAQAASEPPVPVQRAETPPAEVQTTRAQAAPPQLDPAHPTPLRRLPARPVTAQATPAPAAPLQASPARVAPLQAAPAPAAPPQPADLTPSLDYARNYDAPADNRDAVVPTISTRRRTDLSGGFRRTPPDEVPAPRSNEIPAQRRPADLGDLVTPPRPPSRPDDLAALQSADRGIPQSADRGIPGWRRAGETATDTQGKRPATLADQPPLNTGGEPETDLTRRPADLRDHLRATRPADLAQYTHNQKPEAPRRPATLADHISDPRTPVEDEA